jgi:hypothetical protein
MTKALKNCSKLLLAALALMGFSINIACAQTVMDQSYSKQSFAANQLNEIDLPAPGSSLNITAHSFDRLDLQPKARVVYVRDGELTDVFLPPSRLGSNGRPEYMLNIPAPVSDLSYQFFRYNPDGTITSSQKVFVNRNCLPKSEYSIKDYEIKTHDSREKILYDARRANALEKELAVTDYVINLIDEIQQITADE